MSTEKCTPVERSQRARHPQSHLNVYDTAIYTPSDAGSILWPSLNARCVLACVTLDASVVGIGLSMVYLRGRLSAENFVCVAGA